MKTLFRLVRRYITAAFLIVLSVFVLSISVLLSTVIYFGSRDDVTPNGLSQLAESFAPDASGQLVPHPDKPFEEYHFAWAMLLSDSGEILWEHNLPDHLNHPYTLSQAVVFSRWYMDDYPIFCYKSDYGMLVFGMPKGSFFRYNFYMQLDMFNALLNGILPFLAVMLALIFGACLLLAWTAAKGLRSMADGLDRLARGEDVFLPERGTTAELAAQLNKTSLLLRQKDEQIRQRDSARTRWIAGVSHDIRTPLSLIFLHAEELENDRSLSPALHQKAAVIGAQGQKIRALIEDLNLTSKLQYDAQPLRLKRLNAGAFLRTCLADFCNSPLADSHPAELDLSCEAGQCFFEADEALLRRALDNLLGNSARHTPPGCSISVRAEASNDQLVITLSDDGPGYPPAVLAILRGEPSPSELDAPHILGLYLVRQIAQAHGGSAVFSNAGGAQCVLTLPNSQATEN